MNLNQICLNTCKRLIYKIYDKSMDINRAQIDIDGSDDKCSATLITTHVNVVVEFYPWGGSVAEWSARQTRNPAVPGSSPALATCWICSQLSRVQILGHACK